MPLPPPLLVVEDDPTIARAIKRELKAHGFECILAQSAEEARGGSYSGLAIVDINLPDGNGLDLFEELNADGHVMSAVFFSATQNLEECERAQRLGKFVPKSSGVHMAVATALQLLRTSTPPRSATRPSNPQVANSDRDPIQGGDEHDSDELAPARARMRSGTDY